MGLECSCACYPTSVDILLEKCRINVDTTFLFHRSVPIELSPENLKFLKHKARFIIWTNYFMQCLHMPRVFKELGHMLVLRLMGTLSKEAPFRFLIPFPSLHFVSCTSGPYFGRASSSRADNMKSQISHGDIPSFLQR